MYIDLETPVKIEQMNAHKRRMKQQEHKREVEQLIEKRRAIEQAKNQRLVEEQVFFNY